MRLRTIFATCFLLAVCALRALDVPSVSYSLKDSKGIPLDHKLAKIMNFRNGVFVEVGAYDGVTYSNTKLFEEFYEWTGILIEPSKDYFDQLCVKRPNSKCFQCALGAFEQNGSYAYGCFNDGPMSSFNREGRPNNIRVLIRSLQSILDECNLRHVDFFSLDVEGYEFNVLNGIDFNKVTFDYLLIEIRSYDYSKIVSFLMKKGYDMISSFSNYNKADNPGWDGTHNDYLFKRRKEC